MRVPKTRGSNRRSWTNCCEMEEEIVSNYEIPDISNDVILMLKQ